MNHVPILISVTMMITNVCLSITTRSALTNILIWWSKRLKFMKFEFSLRLCLQKFLKLTWNCLPGLGKIRRKLKKCSNIIGSENEITFDLYVKIFFNRFIHRKFPIFSIFESNLNVKKTSFFTFFTLKPPPLFNNPTWAWQNLFASKTFLSRRILKLRLKTDESHHKSLHLMHWRPHCSAINLISNGSNFIAVIDNDLRLSKLHFISSSMMYSFN